MTDKELDDLFQKTLSGHQMPVPPDMWQRVNPQKEKRRRVAFLWWSGLGMAALFALMGTGIWLYQMPSTAVQASTAKQAGAQPAESSSKHITVLPALPAEPPGKSDNLPGSNNKITSTQTSQQANNRNLTPATDFYRKQNNNRENQAITAAQQSATPDQLGNGIGNTKNNTQPNDNSNHKNGKASITSGSTEITASEITASSNQPDASNPQTKDSSTAMNAGKATQQESQSAAVKMKKIHGEKAPSFELMVAGYGDNRNVYDVSRLSATGIVAFGPVSQKEKVLMHSFSINARIEKPLTKNISVTTGIQYLQTRQRVSYSYETVYQSSVVNALGTDTTVSARLQSRQSVVRGNYNSLGVPVLINYHTNQAKVNFGATAGVIVNVLSWYNGEVPDEGSQQTVAAKDVFRTHTGASLYAGITASKQIGSFQLFAEPHIQYTLSSTTKSAASFRQKITSYGFGIGIRKTIGK